MSATAIYTKEPLIWKRITKICVHPASTIVKGKGASFRTKPTRRKGRVMCLLNALATTSKLTHSNP